MLLFGKVRFHLFQFELLLFKLGDSIVIRINKLCFEIVNDLLFRIHLGIKEPFDELLSTLAELFEVVGSNLDLLRFENVHIVLLILVGFQALFLDHFD